MADIHPQASFNSGEWAPNLYARVDMQKYRSGAALLENFYVDYRGGASTRTGTGYVIQARNSANQVRLIPFQATSTIGYALEFGQNYLRFIYRGAPVLEDPLSVTAATQSNPATVTIPGNTYVPGDWIYLSNLGGMTELNNRYYIIQGVAGDVVELMDLRGTNIDSTGYTPYTSGGTSGRVYTLATPYLASELTLLKYAQNGGRQMILCHPAHPAYRLDELSANSWTLSAITIGTTATVPTGVSATITSSGSTGYAYVVTSVDVNGQESGPSAVTIVIGGNMQTDDHSTVNVSWASSPSADHYRIYKSIPCTNGLFPEGLMYGYVGFSHGTGFVDTNISPDFSQTPPIARNPFAGNGILSVTITAPGTYTSVPTIAFTGVIPTIPAVANAVLQVQGTPTVAAGGSGYAVGDSVVFPNSVILVVATETAGAVTAWQPMSYPQSSPGQITSGSTPTNPVSQISTSGSGTGATANLTWGVGAVNITNAGAGYTSTPTVLFTPSGATGTANVDPTDNGNPSVPAFVQQRLVLAAPNGAPQTFWMSQTGNYFNYDTSLPVQGDDAITGTLVSSVLNTIQSILPSTAGMLVFTDTASWLINGGQSGSAIKPDAVVANIQSYIGANHAPPIAANYDILFIQQKGSVVRDLSYNIYFNVFTGTDITTISSHLFYGYRLDEWCWAEEPYKIVWTPRQPDGTMLTLTFMKEQEFVGWSHHTTQGSFRSVCAVTETTSTGVNVDAVYTVVDRVVAGQTWKYIERFAERNLTSGVAYAWCVDSAVQYNGSPATTFSGVEHLAGLTITGLADGVVIPPFTAPASGTFTLPVPASVVTVGLAFTCKLQTLALEMGEPTVQGKVKKINNATVRVVDTIGLEIGPDFDHLQPMKDLIRGNVGSMLTGQSAQVVTGLFTGDARSWFGSGYTVPGQYCIQQSLPLPATVLGVFPSFTIGDV